MPHLGLAEHKSETTRILSDYGAVEKTGPLELDTGRQPQIEIEALEYLVGHLVLLQ